MDEPSTLSISTNECALILRALGELKTRYRPTAIDSAAIDGLMERLLTECDYKD